MPYRLINPETATTWTFPELAVTSAVLERNLDSAGDRLVLTCARGLASPPALPLGQRLDLVDSAGVIRFSGWLLAPELTAAAGGDAGHRYVLEGPQWWLERLTWLQPGWQFPTDLDELDGALAPQRHGGTILNQRTDFLPATTPDQLAEALSWAQDQGVPINFTLTGLPEITPPETELQDPTLWELLEALLTWLPHWHWRWEYGGGLSTRPRLRFLAGENARALPAAACSAITARPRRDLLLGQLELQWLTLENHLVTDSEAPDDSVLREWLVPTPQESTAPGDPALPGTLRITRQLRGALTQLIFDEETGQYVEEELVPAESPPTADFAALLHTAFATPAADLHATIESADVDWSWHPGQRLTLPDLAEGWGSPAGGALIHTVRHTLESGRTELIAGPDCRRGRELPTRGGGLREILRAQQQQSFNSSTRQRLTGAGSKTTGGSGGSQPTPKRIRIYGCENGYPVYYLFRPSTAQGPYPV